MVPQILVIISSGNCNDRMWLDRHEAVTQTSVGFIIDRIPRIHPYFISMKM